MGGCRRVDGLNRMRVVAGGWRSSKGIKVEKKRLFVKSEVPLQWIESERGGWGGAVVCVAES